jgi:hypothetical protein
MTYRSEFGEVQRDAWWSLPRVLLSVVVFLVAVYGLGFLATGGDLAIYSFWAPKRADAENKVFHATQAYTDGKVSYIGRLCRSVAIAEGAERKALQSEVLNEADEIDITKLPANEQTCVEQARGY